MTNKNIDLPSKRHGGEWKFDAGIIEKPLRRKFRSAKTSGMTRMAFWLILLVEVLLVLTALHIFVSRVVDDQAHAAEISKESTYSSLCAQYKADTSLVGTAAEKTLKEICN